MHTPWDMVPRYVPGWVLHYRILDPPPTDSLLSATSAVRVVPGAGAVYEYTVRDVLEVRVENSGGAV